ncbi:hypothetical protein MATL_G00069850 [Megalops atlanticus]|uniref:Uncharacterized protein n=1 Tax=Megalops atlanticus TaxID=7932 RepID=A0A9D3Q5B6_MEGAT|nr:hypothetical protein MATL_G00069850 [Megalops atlanticus]
MKGGHRRGGCGCQHLFRKVLAKCGCCYARVRESYSAAGSEGSIATSVASLPPQASGSSAPSSPGSRHSVSTLKKWLTNPVRKLSAGGGAGGKSERQVRRLDGKPPPSQQSQDPGAPGEGDVLSTLPTADKEPEWAEGQGRSEDFMREPPVSQLPVRTPAAGQLTDPRRGPPILQSAAR